MYLSTWSTVLDPNPGGGLLLGLPPLTKITAGSHAGLIMSYLSETQCRSYNFFYLIQL